MRFIDFFRIVSFRTFGCAYATIGIIIYLALVAKFKFRLCYFSASVCIRRFWFDTRISFGSVYLFTLTIPL